MALVGYYGLLWELRVTFSLGIFDLFFLIEPPTDCFQPDIELLTGREDTVD